MSDLSHIPTYDLARELAARFATDRPEFMLTIAEIAERINPCRHSPDFASVSWYDNPYYFNPSEAAILAVLWKAREDRIHDVRQETLLAAANLETKRIARVFEGNPAWGTLIKSGLRRGSYRLADPDYVPPSSR